MVEPSFVWRYQTTLAGFDIAVVPPVGIDRVLPAFGRGVYPGPLYYNQSTLCEVAEEGGVCGGAQLCLAIPNDIGWF